MILETLMLAQREIRRNVMRSTLTILGIVIGVAAVIILVTLGSGATQQVADQIGSLGSNILQVRPGQGPRGPGGARDSSDEFDMDDVEAIAREVPGLAAIAPMSSASTQAIYGNENWGTSITGTTNDYLIARNWELESGRQFLDAELQAGRAVAILGATVKEELFGGQEAVGQAVRLGSISFEVIGVLTSKGESSFGQDQDDLVLIPIRTVQRRFTGSTDVGSIMISVADSDNIDLAKSSIESLLRERRRISETEDDDFNVGDMREIASTITSSTKVLTALLSAVAAVSLLVGGIGIMNIMLVSVTERTREIGIRLAIGALGSQVLLQFLVEAIVLSCFGGLLGIIFGLGIARIGAQLLSLPFVFRFDIVLLAFAFSAVVGVAFGYFPARKAADLDPIEALRYE
ncbi:MAG: putative transport system permease protein [Candidatus Sumerlaeota bacterium]|nr:putative transport system permease protein [Candidatus Sumerlaeota bacterium]